MFPTDGNVTIFSFLHVVRQTEKETVDGKNKMFRTKSHAKCCTFPGSLMGECQTSCDSTRTLSRLRLTNYVFSFGPLIPISNLFPVLCMMVRKVAQYKKIINSMLTTEWRRAEMWLRERTEEDRTEN